jgi:hypothetical protein
LVCQAFVLDSRPADRGVFVTCDREIQGVTVIADHFAEVICFSDRISVEYPDPVAVFLLVDFPVDEVVSFFMFLVEELGDVFLELEDVGVGGGQLVGLF